MIGNPIVSTDFPVDYKSGNGSTAAFTLSIAPASVNSIDVQISGVSQSPQTYSVSGTTLTFSAAPPTGTNNIVVRHLGIAGIPNTPSAASVVTASIADANVTQAKLASNVAGTGPAFSAYIGSAQTLSGGTNTKLAFNTEVFDTNNNFDSTTNYRFTPTVAGYYQISAGYTGFGPSGGDQQVAIRKNGSTIAKGGFPSASAGYTPNPVVSCLIYFNGSTDYIEAYGYQSGTNSLQIGVGESFFTGVLVRAA